ncbi:alpha/beta fold hydrolase [Mangrovibacterium lignilyticum]|uniref:alpha/beta fold hydrolase n=1 Tax=Mangrovibacterium lignilyticum TaxID=2668052 RepID=UPI0013D57371|nr:alpha/beta hydrolase [Mangrovibacterium lignilyticum]
MKAILMLLVLVIAGSCTNSMNEKIAYGSNEKAGQYVDVNGIKIYCEIYGEGEPLLLLHGNGGSIVVFEKQIPELSKHFKVIAVDSRAQGKSSDSEDEISYALMGSDMNELIDQLKLERVAILGWSDGGNIGLELAYAHPEKVTKLITIGANYSWEDFSAASDSVQMDPHDPLYEKVSPMMLKYRAAYKVISPDIKKKLNDLMEKYPNFTKEQLHEIQVPVLVVSGDHDLIKLEHTLALFNSLPHAQLFVVPRASHMVPAEQPELINSEVVRFITTPYRDLGRYYFTEIGR